MSAQNLGLKGFLYSIAGSIILALIVVLLIIALFIVGLIIGLFTEIQIPSVVISIVGALISLYIGYRFMNIPCSYCSTDDTYSFFRRVGFA